MVDLLDLLLHLSWFASCVFFADFCAFDNLLNSTIMLLLRLWSLETFISLD